MEDSTQIDEEASTWMITLIEQPGNAQLQAQFDVWLNQSVEHRQSWERLVNVWHMLGQTKSPSTD